MTEAESEAIWTRVAAGLATEAELRALEAQAEHDPRVRSMLQACRPPPPNFDERIADRFAAPRRSWAPRAAGVAAAIVATAAVVLVFVLPAPPLPRYILERGRGVDSVRGASDASVLEVRPATRVRLVLRPLERVDDALVVSAFVERDGELHPWSGPFTVSDGGTVRVDALAGELWPERNGAFTVVLAVDREHIDADQLAAVRAAGRAHTLAVHFTNEVP